MDKKAILGLISVCVVAVALVAFVFINLKPDSVDRGFTLSLEPDELTLRVGEYRNLTINVVSTGYEGDITLSDPTCSWTTEEPSPTLEWQIIPGSDEPNARFIEADGKLTLTLRIKCMGSPGTLYLRIAAYGNYGKGNEFKVDSLNSVKIEITLPS